MTASAHGFGLEQYPPVRVVREAKLAVLFGKPGEYEASGCIVVVRCTASVAGAPLQPVRALCVGRHGIWTQIHGWRATCGV
jgi:hypothetical protein